MALVVCLEVHMRSWKDVSGMPTIGLPVEYGGFGFDYRTFAADRAPRAPEGFNPELQY